MSHLGPEIRPPSSEAVSQPRCSECGGDIWEIVRGRIKCLNCGHVEEKIWVVQEDDEHGRSNQG